ncbi:MAG TPA: hypothetical protein VNL71_25855 [Chloroflexota bacterium]|nr:hypothetical protein [Chloroflexota bacterium]
MAESDQAADAALLSPIAVMLIEALGTAMLHFFILALVDRPNRVRQAETWRRSSAALAWRSSSAC